MFSLRLGSRDKTMSARRIDEKKDERAFEAAAAGEG
jgi:hypothetical protein